MPITASQVLDASNAALAPYQNRHRGQRCYIIGNGPSLNRMDLSFLKDEITFGMNRIYLLFDKWDFRPTYYVSVNPLVIEQSVEEILKIPAPRFLSLNGLPYFSDPSQAIFLHSDPRPQFFADPRNGLWEGYTVTYVAMQLAYFMGFSEVILIGVDHHFTTPGPANLEVVSEGADPNHFHPDYFGKGVRWNLPDLRNSEVAYHLAKEAYELAGRRIIDATLDGKLTIFPKVDYQQLAARHQAREALAPGHLSETEFLNQQGEKLFELGDLAGAEAMFKGVLTLASQHPQANNNLGVLASSSDVHKALEYFHTALASDPNDRQLIVNLGSILFELGEVETACALARGYLENHPGDDEISALLASWQPEPAREATSLSRVSIPIYEFDATGAVVPNPLFHRPWDKLHSRCIEYPYAAAQVKAGQTILDVGTAKSDPVWKEWLETLPLQVHATDFDPPKFSFKRVSFHQGDIRHLDLPDNLFDLVMAVSVIEHIGLHSPQVLSETLPTVDADGDVEAVRELARLLKPGGQLVMTFPFGPRAGLILGNEARNYTLATVKRFEQVLEPVKLDFYEYQYAHARIRCDEYPASSAAEQQRVARLQQDDPGLVVPKSAQPMLPGSVTWRLVSLHEATALQLNHVDGVLCGVWRKPR